MLIEECSAKPLDVFRKIYAQPFAFFLDSCGTSRYSLLGIDPLILIKAQNNKVEVSSCGETKITTDDVFTTVSSIFNKFKKAKRGLPSPFPFQGGGMAGYFGYDLKNQIENLPMKKAAEPAIPDCMLGVYDTIFIYDFKINKGYCISAGLTPDGREEKLLAKERISRLFDIINTDDSQKILPSQTISYKDNIESNFTKSGYIDAIKIIQGYIASGDIYQANLSQRFIINYSGEPAALYNALRKINPAPYGAFLNYRDFQIISNSPEGFLKIKGNIAETSPIKGTRPRGKNITGDKYLTKELKNSKKEKAEHIMIVDLERSDLGRFCEYGSIKVKSLKKICAYPTLHHMVSTVTGKIKNGMGPVDCLRLFFPGGSVTGAPKIRAMEIIEKMEPTPRGIYTGAIGWMDFYGNMDMSIAIRTAVLKNKRLYLNVGGGIVADSNPEEEYHETILKAKAFFKAIGIKEQGLGIRNSYVGLNVP